MVAKLKEKAGGCFAVHGETEDRHIVGIGNLRVVVLQDEGRWFAQGLEIDYLAEGESLADAKKNFEKGLKATITLNLQATGSIEKMLRIAPPEVWNETMFFPGSKLKRFSGISVHEVMNESIDRGIFPFMDIDYFAPIDALSGQ